MQWRPGVLVGCCTALWIDALAGGGLVAGVPAVVVVAVVALASGLGSGLLPLAVSGVASAALLSVADQVAEPGRFSLASDGVFYCVIVLAPALVGWLLGSRNRQIADLKAHRRELESRRAVAVRTARASERERVIRRIDLRLADRLHRVVVDAQRTSDMATREPDRMPDHLEAVENAARDTLAGLREVLGTLRDADTLTPPDVSASRPVTVADPPARRRRRVDLIDAALLLAPVPLAIETALRPHPGPTAADVVVSLAQGVALVLLRRRPLPGVVLLLVLATVQTAALAPLPPTVSWLLPALLAAFLLGLTRSRSTALAGLVVLVVGVVCVSAATPAGHRAMAGFVPGLVMGLLAWLGGRLSAERAARARELRAITEELNRTREDEAHLAALEQRAEMARDVHDAGAHALTVVCLQACAARTWWDRDRARANHALASLIEVADQTLAQLGDTLGGIARGIETDMLDPDALQIIAGIGRALGLDVAIDISGPPRRLPNDVLNVAHRVLQEGLTNAARHAAGSMVRVELAYVVDGLEVRIADTGGNADHTSVVNIIGTGSGLRGMRERVEALRGELQAGPRGRGFEILARLPT